MTSQAEYAKKLRALLPPEAFLPDASKLWILIINLVILILGWAIATHLDRWSVYLLWLYLPFAFLMGNSVVVLLSNGSGFEGSLSRSGRVHP